jgi:hypothetical protein
MMTKEELNEELVRFFRGALFNFMVNGDTYSPFDEKIMDIIRRGGNPYEIDKRIAGFMQDTILWARMCSLYDEMQMQEGVAKCVGNDKVRSM